MQYRPLPQREQWVDGLRVIAVLGVFVVNAMGYPFAPNYPAPVGAPQPIESPIALLIHGLLVAFVQGKAWPLLCFLFGYSLSAIALQSRSLGLVTCHVLRVRYWKLLVIGVLHGALVYFGDILTAYAVCGLVCSRWALVRPAKLLKIWKRITVVFIIFVVLNIWAGINLLLNSSPGDAIAQANQAAIKLFEVSDVRKFWVLNIQTYFGAQMQALFLLPVFLWLTLAGMLSRRFRLLSTRHFSRLFWSRHILSWQLWGALLMNVALGIADIKIHSVVGLHEVALSGISALGGIANLWLSVALLAWVMRRRCKNFSLPLWVVWLAPAGRHTLAMYLVLSLGLMLTSHVYLGLSGNIVTRLTAVVTAWFLAVGLARYASSRNLRDPIARWLSTGISSKIYEPACSSSIK